MPKHNVPTRIAIPMSLALGLGALLFGAPGANSSEVSGTGSGAIQINGVKRFITVNLSAHSGPQGATGSERWTIPDVDCPLDAHIDVDCLNAFPQMAGPTAWVGGVVKRVNQDNCLQLKPGDRVLTFIADYGTQGQLGNDELIPIQFSDLPCDAFFDGIGGAITSGNYIINLAQ